MIRNNILEIKKGRGCFSAKYLVCRRLHCVCVCVCVFNEIVGTSKYRHGKMQEKSSFLAGTSLFIFLCTFIGGHNASSLVRHCIICGSKLVLIVMRSKKQVPPKSTIVVSVVNFCCFSSKIVVSVVFCMLSDDENESMEGVLAVCISCFL